jgi:hypothetical protein
VSFAEDIGGELYAVALFDQKIHKLTPSAAPAPSSFPQRLSETGCVLAGDATKPAAGVLPFDVNAALWSDGADKERWLAIPDGTTIGVGEDGDFGLPIGSTVLKTFSFGGKRIETRLFVRHDDGEWAGYSYEWNDAQTDATLLLRMHATDSKRMPPLGKSIEDPQGTTLLDSWIGWLGGCP